MTLDKIMEAALSNWKILIFVLLSLIEVSKIKINPWSALLGWIGNALTFGLKKDINLLDGKVEKMRKELDSMKHETKESDVKNARVRILRFADEVYRGDKHSKESFDNVLDDITSYEIYCKEHPNFRNEKTVIATQRIEAIYNRCMENHEFL